MESHAAGRILVVGSVEPRFMFVRAREESMFGVTDLSLWSG